MANMIFLFHMKKMISLITAGIMALSLFALPAFAEEESGSLDELIAAAQEEIAALASDWNTTTGETVDQHLRKIEMLKKKLSD